MQTAVAGIVEAIDRVAVAETSKKPNKLLLEILYLVIKIAVVVLLFALAFTFAFGIEKVEDNSMVPSFKGGDLALFSRFDDSFVSSDVVVIDYEGDAQLRRVVAVAGDTVDITSDGLVVNGALQQEQNVHTDTLLYEGGVTLPLTLKENEVFVLGDNRLESLDSRMYGPVDTSIIAGKAIFVGRTKNL